MSSSEINNYARKRFYSAATRKFMDSTNPEIVEAFNIGFREGAQFAMRTSSELTPYVSRFADFIMWVMERDEVADQIQEELPF